LVSILALENLRDAWMRPRWCLDATSVVRVSSFK